MALRPLNLFLGAVDKITEPIDRVHRKIDRLTAPLSKVNRQVGKLVDKSGLGRFGRSLQTATRRSLRLAAATGRVVRNLSLIAAGAGVAAALQLKSVAEKGDLIAKTADRIGIGVEALQELRFGAERSGSSVAGLDKGLTNLGQRVGELKGGTGSLFTVLKKLNPALLEQLKATSSTEEAFFLLSDAIKNTDDQTTRLAIANAAAGRSGKELLNFLQLGRDGIQELSREARFLGAVIGEEQARKSEKAVDSLTNLEKAVLGVRDAAGGKLLPFIIQISEQMTKWIGKNRETVASGIAEFVQRLPGYFERVVVVAKQVVDALRPIVSAGIAIAEALGPTKAILIALGVIVGAIVLPPLVALVGAIATIGGAIAGVVGLPALLTAGLVGLTAAAGALFVKLGQSLGPAIEEWLLGIPKKALAVWDDLIAKIKGITNLGLGSIGRFFGLDQEGGPISGFAAAAPASGPAGGLGAAAFGNAAGATVGGAIRVDVVDPGGRARVSTTSEGDVALELETGPTGGAIP